MISFDQDKNKFNFRVGAIIQSPDEKQILVHRLSNFDFWLLPGGRVEMLESTDEAIKREVQEELGTESKVSKLIATTESFFNMKDKVYHELGFNYIVTIPENSSLFQMKGEFAGVEGEKYRYRWCNRELLNQINFKPDYLVPILQNIPKEHVHIIKDERVKEKDDLER